MARKIIKNRKVKATKNASQIKNGLFDAIGFATPGPGIGGGFSPTGFPGQQTVSGTATAFSNLRYYLVSNDRTLLTELFAEIGLVQTICTVPVQDGLRGGVLFKSKQMDEQQLSDLRIEMDREDDLTTATWAATWARLYGGGGILIMVDDQDPELPLDISQIQEGTDLGFRAADMWELFFDKQNIEGYDAEIQEEIGEFYSYYSKPIHKSRVMKLKGIEAPSFIRPRLRGWGVSCIETLIRSMNQYLKATDLSFEVLDEFKIDIYKMKNLVQTLLSPNGANSVQQRIQLANWQKNYQNAVVMDSEDDWDHKQLSFAGLAEAMAGIRQQVAADMRIPQIKLFGQSFSGGMGNSAQDEMENYNAMVEAEVRGKLKYHILRMGEIRCQQLFGFIPDDLECEFKSLRELTATDQENVKTQKFTRLLQAKEAGELTTQEFRDACNKGNLFDIQLDTIEDGLSDEDPEIKGVADDDNPSVSDEAEDQEGEVVSEDSIKVAPKLKVAKNRLFGRFKIRGEK